MGGCYWWTARRTGAMVPRIDLAETGNPDAWAPIRPRAQSSLGRRRSVPCWRLLAFRCLYSANPMEQKPEKIIGAGYTPPMQPLGKIIGPQLDRALGTSGLSFDWRDLSAADIASKARSFAQLVGAGVPMQEAAGATGILNVED